MIALNELVNLFLKKEKYTKKDNKYNAKDIKCKVFTLIIAMVLYFTLFFNFFGNVSLL